MAVGSWASRGVRPPSPEVTRKFLVLLWLRKVVGWKMLFDFKEKYSPTEMLSEVELVRSRETGTRCSDGTGNNRDILKLTHG